MGEGGSLVPEGMLTEEASSFGNRKEFISVVAVDIVVPEASVSRVQSSKALLPGSVLKGSISFGL